MEHRGGPSRTAETCSVHSSMAQQGRISTNSNPRSGASSSVVRRQQRYQQQQSKFDFYMPLCEVQQGLKRGEILEGILRVNPRNYEDSYISAPDGQMDIYVQGLRDRNRAFNGDVVAVQLRPVQEWRIMWEAIKDYEERQGMPLFATSSGFSAPEAASGIAQGSFTGNVHQDVSTSNTAGNAQALQSGADQSSWNQAVGPRAADSLEILGLDQLTLQFQEFTKEEKSKKSKNRSKKNRLAQKQQQLFKSLVQASPQEPNVEGDPNSSDASLDKILQILGNPLAGDVQVDSNNCQVDTNNCVVDSNSVLEETPSITQSNLSDQLQGLQLSDVDGAANVSTTELNLLPKVPNLLSSSDEEFPTSQAVAPDELTGDEFSNSVSGESTGSHQIVQDIEDAEFFAEHQDACNNNSPSEEFPVQLNQNLEKESDPASEIQNLVDQSRRMPVPNDRILDSVNNCYPESDDAVTVIASQDCVDRAVIVNSDVQAIKQGKENDSGIENAAGTFVNVVSPISSVEDEPAGTFVNVTSPICSVENEPACSDIQNIIECKDDNHSVIEVPSGPSVIADSLSSVVIPKRKRDKRTIQNELKTPVDTNLQSLQSDVNTKQKINESVTQKELCTTTGTNVRSQPANVNTKQTMNQETAQSEQNAESSKQKKERPKRRRNKKSKEGSVHIEEPPIASQSFPSNNGSTKGTQGTPNYNRQSTATQGTPISNRQPTAVQTPNSRQTIEVQTPRRNYSRKEQIVPSNVSVQDLLILPNWAKFVQKTGKVVYIIEKKHSRVATGYIKKQQDKNPYWALFSPTDHRMPRLMIPMLDCPKGFYERPDDFKSSLFIATITQWDENSTFARGNLARSLGEAGEINPETEGILIENEIDFSEFSEECLKGLPPVPWTIPQEEFARRRDFRDQCVFTIDPSTARDLDDAVSVRSIGNGLLEVGVHIADVSYFIQEGSPLDLVASQRSTSVYLVQKVVPMLPRVLCEHLCSLNPGEDKLTFSVVWHMSPEGHIVNEWFGRTIIHSCTKFSYEHAQDMIENGERDWGENEFPPFYGRFGPRDALWCIQQLQGLALKLRQKRFDEGALRLDQVKIQFNINNETGMPSGFSIYQQKDSNRLIEEFMLLANKAVAHKIYKSFPEKAFLRCHPPPQTKLINDICETCAAIGIHLDASSAGALQASLARYVGEDVFSIARTNVLTHLCAKPMKPARYFCAGWTSNPHDFHHYALNEPLYTHFTSPIRRYPDVIVHRLLSAALNVGELTKLSALELQKQSSRCNDKKLTARRVHELSCELFLGVFVREAGPLEEQAVVVDVMDHSFDVLIIRMGVIKRIYCDKLSVSRVIFEKNLGIPKLTLFWAHDCNNNIQYITMFTLVQVILNGIPKDPLKFSVILKPPSSQILGQQ